MKLILTQSLFSILLTMMLASPSRAQQLQFSKDVQLKNTHYNYYYKFHNQQQYRLNFNLGNTVITDSRNQFSAAQRRLLLQEAKDIADDIYDQQYEKHNAALRKQLYHYIIEQSKTLPPQLILDADAVTASWRITSTGKFPPRHARNIIATFKNRIRSKWEQLTTKGDQDYQQTSIPQIQQAIIQLYKAQHYVAMFENNTSTHYNVRPDFANIARRYTQNLRPIAKALAINTLSHSKRDILNHTLNFLQTIPYDPLKPRDDNSTSGFISPIQLFDNNKGDCDSKATAMAALVRNLLPGTRMILVTIPQHAFLALNIKVQAGDAYITYKGREYVIVEAAGTALNPVGEPYDSTRQYLKQGSVTEQQVFYIPSGQEDGWVSVYRNE